MATFGVAIGIIFGALPGLTASMGIAILMPITFSMAPESGLIMMGAIFAGAMWGGSVSAILINTPGTPGAAATVLDGYPMAKQGRAADALRESVAKDVENRSKADYDDKFFVDLIEKIKEGATFKYHQHALEHEGEHVLEDLSQRLSQQGMDLDTYFKLRNTTREQFIETEVKPVAKKLRTLVDPR